MPETTSSSTTKADKKSEHAIVVVPGKRVEVQVR